MVLAVDLLGKLDPRSLMAVRRMNICSKVMLTEVDNVGLPVGTGIHGGHDERGYVGCCEASWVGSHPHGAEVGHLCGVDGARLVLGEANVVEDYQLRLQVRIGVAGLCRILR